MGKGDKTRSIFPKLSDAAEGRDEETKRFILSEIDKAVESKECYDFYPTQEKICRSPHQIYFRFEQFLRIILTDKSNLKTFQRVERVAANAIKALNYADPDSYPLAEGKFFTRDQVLAVIAPIRAGALMRMVSFAQRTPKP